MLDIHLYSHVRYKNVAERSQRHTFLEFEYLVLYTITMKRLFMKIEVLTEIPINM